LSDRDIVFALIAFLIGAGFIGFAFGYSLGVAHTCKNLSEHLESLEDAE